MAKRGRTFSGLTWVEAGATGHPAGAAAMTERGPVFIGWAFGRRAFGGQASDDLAKPATRQAARP